MSSRSTPAQLSPNNVPYSSGPAARNHAMAAVPFPSPGPHVLPPYSVLAGSAIKHERPTHLQPTYGRRPSPVKLERLDVSNSANRAVTALQAVSSLPPPPRRTTHQGAAPLGQLLHPAPSHRWDSVSPSTSYSSRGSERSSYGAALLGVTSRTSPTEYSSYHGAPSAATNYLAPSEATGAYWYASATSDTRPASSSRVPRTTEAPRKAPDITDRYNLKIRQQPLAARACGFGERDRRVIDPPPIVQLSLTDFDPLSSTDVSELRWPFNVVHCALLSVPSPPYADLSDTDVTTVTDPNDANKLSRRLMGTLVASPFIGTDPDAAASPDPNARLGCFFIFPDLSCRQNGRYRLRFTLMKVNVEMTPTGGQSSIIGAVESDVFEVFSAKDFPGMRASTTLTKELKLQGAAVSVKKGNEAKAGKKAKRRGGDTATTTTTASKSDSDENTDSDAVTATATATTTAAAVSVQGTPKKRTKD